jgi:hypothetical protein
MDVQEGESIAVLEHKAEHNNCRMRALESDLEPSTPTEGPLK